VVDEEDAESGGKRHAKKKGRPALLPLLVIDPDKPPVFAEDVPEDETKDEAPAAPAEEEEEEEHVITDKSGQPLRLKKSQLEVEVERASSPIKRSIGKRTRPAFNVKKYGLLPHHREDLGKAMGPGYYPARFERPFNIIVWVDHAMLRPKTDQHTVGVYRPRREEQRVICGDNPHTSGDLNWAPDTRGFGSKIARAGAFRHIASKHDWDEFITDEVRPDYKELIKWFEVDNEKLRSSAFGGGFDWRRITKAVHSGQCVYDGKDIDVRMSCGMEDFKQEVLLLMCIDPKKDGESHIRDAISKYHTTCDDYRYMAAEVLAEKTRAAAAARPDDD
jgi:hypothetical protein